MQKPWYSFIFKKRLARIHAELDMQMVSGRDEAFELAYWDESEEVSALAENSAPAEAICYSAMPKLERGPLRSEPCMALNVSLDDVLDHKSETFSNMLLRLIDEKGLKDSDVYKRANIDRRLFSKIRGDEDYVPSKKTAIAFCLALHLNLDEAKKLLERAGYALSDASRFDLIITYLIENSEYNVHFANIVLNDYGEGTLSK